MADPKYIHSIVPVPLAFLVLIFGLTCSEAQGLPSDASSFDQATATEALHLSYAAFCNETALSGWDCQWCNTTQGTKLIQFVHNTDFGTRGYVALSPRSTSQSARVIVAYRGSSNWQNWLEDAEAALQINDPFDKNSSGVKLAAGFYVAYKSVRDVTQTAISTALAQPACKDQQQKNQCEVHFHGHSLGAAMAVIAAYDTIVKYNIQPLMEEMTSSEVIPLKVKLYTFGCPRAGNAALATVMGRFASGSLRMARLHDPVPGLPLENMLGEKYHHYSHEVYNTYTETYGEQNYTVCDGSGEDPKCYDSEWGIIKMPSEHTKYMGVDGGGCAGG